MTTAHLHLLTIHAPLTLAPLAFLFLAWVELTGRTNLRRLALGLSVLAGLAFLPPYLTGEGAEDVVKALPGVTKGLIHEHEEAAEIALVLGLLSAALAGAQLIWPALEKRRGLARLPVLALGLTSGAAAITGQRGGQIRRPELRGTSAVSIDEPPASDSGESDE